jgi:hypothetical protein
MTSVIASGLITLSTIQELNLTSRITPLRFPVVHIDVLGKPVPTTGIITLQWRDESHRHVFKTTFLVVPGYNLQWSIILGAPEIQRLGILDAPRFDVEEGERAGELKESAWKREHDEMCADNDRRVAAHKEQKRMEEQRTKTDSLLKSS